MAALLTAAELALAGCATQRGFPPSNGIQNYDEVTSVLWRGAQPSGVALEGLAKRGCIKVINLRGGDADPFEAFTCERLNMAYVHLPLSPIGAPSNGAIERALSEIDNARGPVFVHCQYGCERTGMVIACWRIRQGADPRDALKEALAHGMTPAEWPMKHFIRTFK